MQTIKNILLATDFSEASDDAATHAMTLAQLTGAHLHVLHVISELEEHQRVMVPREAFQTLQQEIEIQTIKELERFCAGKADCVSSTSHAVIGKPYRAIVDTAEKIGVDMIVMGTHGRTGVEHVLVGSTAERVVRHSTIPV
ncbi:MAG: universal stress protein, partial [Desulfuromonadales bacterium]|nr:universal stress protein [Desulfuromonadales bacterium]